jgi:pilus assembly protein CpaD
MNQTKSRRLKSRSLLLAAAVAAATACTPPDRINDYRANHQISVVKETVTLTTKLPVADNGFAGIEQANFERFVRRFLDGGRGQLTIEAAAGNRAEENAADQMRNLLLKEGLRPQEIAIATGGAGDGAIRLSYESSVAMAPDCENWSSNATYNWPNLTHSNYGCSIQRNLGLMVSDPGDLDTAKPMTGADGDRNAASVLNYRKAAKGGGKQETAKGATGK